jgi:hypothetical protein
LSPSWRSRASSTVDGAATTSVARLAADLASLKNAGTHDDVKSGV